MAKSGMSLLAELEAGLRDDKTTTTSLLQKCILLGGKAGSERLRDWARQELKGYHEVDLVPEYRRVVAPLCIDGATFGGLITGQQISSMSLPEFAREYVTEDLALTNALGELEGISRGPEDTVRLQPPDAQELVVLWNHQNSSADRITRLYWQVSRSTIAGVITGVRTALAELVAELLAVVPDGDQPCTLRDLDLLSQRRVQFALQEFQFPVAFHPAEFLFCFQQPRGRPAQRVITGPPALHIPGHFFHDGKARLDGIAGSQRLPQQRAHA